jgi:hypothetical protein
MEEAIMTCKRSLMLFPVLLLLAALPAIAQRGMAHTGSRSGGSFRHSTGFQGGGAGRSTPFYGPSSYPTYFSTGSYSPASAPAYSPYMRGDDVVTYNAQPVMAYDVYVPSYMRPNDGPSLAEVAASLKTTRKPAVLTWTSWPTSPGRQPLPELPAARKQ